MSGWAASLPGCRPRSDLFFEGIAHLTCLFRRPDGDADCRAATVDEGSVGRFVVQREPDGLRKGLVCTPGRHREGAFGRTLEISLVEQVMRAADSGRRCPETAL